MPAPTLSGWTPPRSLGSCIPSILEELHARLKNNHEGEVATYIPELGKADPDWFGICLVTADGRIYEAGDCGQSFTIQSISKPFIYGAALEDNGKAAVLDKIWMEPSGEAFNAISLRPDSGKPENPMINAGAIASTSLVEGNTATKKIRRILDSLGRHAGRELTVDQSVYRSESSTGHRNRAIGHMLRNFEILEQDPHESLEAYFMQCAVSVTCRDLGVMAATLANGGTNPVTGKRAVMREYVGNILSVMGSCGMYDAAGEWIYNVGMPAKSGVAGGIVAVLPGQLGIGVFSPRLDPCGNSVRGVLACRELSRSFGLHMFNVPRFADGVVRRVSHLPRTRSSRLRSPREADALRASEKSIRVLELQGDLNFASGEVAARELPAAAEDATRVIVDFSHVTSCEYSAARILAMAFSKWLESGRHLSICHAETLSPLRRLLKSGSVTALANFSEFPDQVHALEAAEDALLDELDLRASDPEDVTPAECELLQGIDPEELAALELLTTRVTFPRGGVVIRAGDPPGSLYFLLSGKASAWISTGSGRERRVATFLPGMNFGEMALLDDSPRSAEIRADSRIVLMELDLESFRGLNGHPGGLQLTLLRNLSRILAKRLREANAEIADLLP